MLCTAINLVSTANGTGGPVRSIEESGLHSSHVLLLNQIPIPYPESVKLSLFGTFLMVLISPNRPSFQFSISQIIQFHLVKLKVPDPIFTYLGTKVKEIQHPSSTISASLRLFSISFFIFNRCSF